MKQLEKGRISSFQYMCMLLVVRITATTVTFPFMTDHESPTDAWIGAAIGIVVSLVLLELYSKIFPQFPQHDRDPVQPIRAWQVLRQYCSTASHRILGF